VKEGVDAVPGLINELKDQNTARQEEVQKLRDEVKGLYVETSSLRQQLDELRGDIGGVNANVSAFRTFSGFFIAVMILLLAVIFVMSIRR
jgi:predicted nuclease with TOPRIM domain